MNFGNLPTNKIIIPQEQGNSGIMENNVLNLKLNKNNINTIKLTKNGPKKVNASGNQEKMDTNI